MRFRILCLSFVLLFVLATTKVFAQSHNSFRVDIPFDFMVNDKTMPAGQYTVSQVNADYEVLSGQDGTMVTFAPATVRGSIGSNNLLIFHQLGDQYFLAEVWPAGTSMGRAVGGQSLEKEMRKSLVARDVKVISGGTKVAMVKTK